MIKTSILVGLIIGICTAFPNGGRVGPPRAASDPFTRGDDNKLDEKPRFGSAGGPAPAPGAAPPAPAAPAPPPPPPPPPPPVVPVPVPNPVPVPVTQAPPPPMMPAAIPAAPAPLPAAAPAAPLLPEVFPVIPVFPTLPPPVPCESIAGECKKEGELCEAGTQRSDDYCRGDDYYCCSPASTFYW